MVENREYHDPRAERRLHPRYPADDAATLLLVNQGCTVAGRIVELSLGGCRLRLARKYRVGYPVPVEISFRINGMAFRLGGVTQWSDEGQTVGIRFGAMSSRRKDDLVELIAELEAEQAGRAAKEAGEKAAAETTAAAPISNPPQRRGAASTAVSPAKSAPPSDGDPPVAQPASVSQAPLRERRQQIRHRVDTHASLFFINVAVKVTGRILDVSLTGCRLRTDERFPSGIYRRVETEFKIDGLPFRLGGVVQSIHDRHTVGIRFLNLSDRKREHLLALMEEIEDMRKRGYLDIPPAGSKTGH